MLTYTVQTCQWPSSVEIESFEGDQSLSWSCNTDIFLKCQPTTVTFFPRLSLALSCSSAALETNWVSWHMSLLPSCSLSILQVLLKESSGVQVARHLGIQAFHWKGPTPCKHMKFLGTFQMCKTGKRYRAVESTKKLHLLTLKKLLL